MLTITRTSFHYNKLTPEQIDERGREHYGNFKYRLARIESSTHQAQIATDGIEKSTVCGPDLAQIQVFNEVFIAECNSDSIRIVFHDGDSDAGSYSFSPLSSKLTRKADAPPATQPATQPAQSDDGDTFFAASGQTMVHDYAETHSGRFFHVGISLLPIGPIFMPLWLCNDRLHRLVTSDWPKLIETAKKESLLVLRCLDGRHSIRHALPRANEKNA
jgi:hypothetical protein